jgi:hypothetical protein
VRDERGKPGTPAQDPGGIRTCLMLLYLLLCL